jgi:hypothetical protein
MSKQPDESALILAQIETGKAEPPAGVIHSMASALDSMEAVFQEPRRRLADFVAAVWKDLFETEFQQTVDEVARGMATAASGAPKHFRGEEIAAGYVLTVRSKP